MIQYECIIPNRNRMANLAMTTDTISTKPTATVSDIEKYVSSFNIEQWTI